MSARREKRLRQLERRVEALEFTTERLVRRLGRVEDAISEMAVVKSELKVQDADWAPVPLRRSLWRRLLDAIMGRDEP